MNNADKRSGSIPSAAKRNNKTLVKFVWLILTPEIGMLIPIILICVLTNKDQSDAEHILAYYFPAVHFSAVRGRVPGVALKPHPQGALLIAKALEIAPEDFWYVGDTRMDMLCGNAAGMETIGVLWGFRPRAELTESGAKHLAKNAAELLQIVDG